MLDRLAWSTQFENFLANKYAAAKRFGLEGCETLIPGMKALIDSSADMGVNAVVIGMPHRGMCACPARPREAWIRGFTAVCLGGNMIPGSVWDPNYLDLEAGIIDI